MSEYKCPIPSFETSLTLIFYKDVLEIILSYISLLEAQKSIKNLRAIEQIFCNDKYFVIFDGSSIYAFDLFSCKLLCKLFPQGTFTIYGIFQEDLFVWFSNSYSMSKICLLKNDHVFGIDDNWYPKSVFNCHHGWCVSMVETNENDDWETNIGSKIIRKFEIKRTKERTNYFVDLVWRVWETFEELHIVNHDLFGIFPWGKNSKRGKKLWRIPIELIHLVYEKNKKNTVSKPFYAYAEKFYLPNSIKNVRLAWNIKAVFHRCFVPGTTEKGELFMFNIETQRLYFTNYRDYPTKQFFASNGDHFFVINGSSIEICS